MFDIGFPELVLVAIVGLLVIGPERLPEALRTLGLWLGRMRRSFMSVKSEIEKEIGMDEVRRQLHNEAIMEEMKRIESEVRATANDVKNTMNDSGRAIERSTGADEVNAADDPTTSAEIAPDPDSESTKPLKSAGQTEAESEPTRANNG